jgi:integrase/recombinase XerD
MGKKSDFDFDTAITEFARYLLLKGYSKNTTDGYLRTIKQTLSDKNLKTLKQRDLEDIAIQLGKEFQGNGNRLRYAALNLFCKVILKKEHKELYLKIKKSQIKNKDVLTSEQVEKILEKSKEKRKVVNATILLLYDCALRRSEVCNLNIEDINFDSGELYLRDTKTGDSIGYMNTRVVEVINEYLLYERKPSLLGEKAVFLNKYGKRIGERFLRDNLKQCAVEAGITRRVYPHMLRASCITHLLNKGVNPLTVQRHARHKDFRTTMIYNRPTQQQMKADIERVFSR